MLGLKRFGFFSDDAAAIADFSQRKASAGDENEPHVLEYLKGGGSFSE